MRNKRSSPNQGNAQDDIRLLCHGCEEMPELGKGSVDLVVTSPPYFVDAGDAFMHPAQLRDGKEIPESYEALLNFLLRCFGEMFRVLKPGGFCCVNVASTRVRGVLYPLPFDLTIRLMQEGWVFQEEILWRRWRSWDRRAGHLIRNPYPGYYFPNRVFEYVLIFKKPGPPIYQGRSKREKQDSKYPASDPLYAHEVANSIWNILPVQPQNKGQHPCPFPEELAARLIELYSYKNDVVLDPFMGSGTTGVAAKLLHRQFVGCEANPAFLTVARKRIGDAATLKRERRICRFEHLPLLEKTPDKALVSS